MKFMDHLPVIFSLLFISAACTQPEPAVREVETPVGKSSRLPYLVTDDRGDAFLSWVENIDSINVALKYARLTGATWSRPTVIAEGGDWFVNWADFPSIAVDDGNPIAAHWLQMVPGDFAYEVKLSMIPSSGPALTLHNDSTATEHGFVSMIPWPKERILAIWLDGRKTAGRADDEYSDLSKAMTLRSAIVSADGTVSGRALIDESVCDCCQTSIARTASGAIAAYRDRTDGEIRDIYVSRFRNGSWSPPALVYGDNWKIGGCPVNGPAVAASGDRILVAWFTGANESNRVKAAFSTDGGESFGEPVSLDNGNPIGRVDADYVDSESAVVSWMEKTGDGAELRVRKINPHSSEPGNSVAVTPIDPGRSSGFPQMAVRGRQLLFAWTETGDPSRIRMASLPVEMLRD